MALNNLRDVRKRVQKERNIKSLELFLEKLGLDIPRSTWLGYERSEKSPSLDVYKKISEVFGYPLEELSYYREDN